MARVTTHRINGQDIWGAVIRFATASERWAVQKSRDELSAAENRCATDRTGRVVTGHRGMGDGDEAVAWGMVSIHRE